MSEEVTREDVSGSTVADTIVGLTPDGLVAQRIVLRLIDEGLIERAHAKEIWAGLAAGTVRSADWRDLAQNALAEE